MKNALLSGMFGIDISKMSVAHADEKIKQFVVSLHPDKLNQTVKNLQGKADSKLYHVAKHLLETPDKISERYEEILFACRCARDVIADSDSRSLYSQVELLCEIYTILNNPEKVVVEKTQMVSSMLTERFKNIEFQIAELEKSRKRELQEDGEEKIAPLDIVKSAISEYEPMTTDDLLDGEKTRHTVKRFRTDMHGQDNFTHCSLCNNCITDRGWKTTCNCKDWYHMDCMFKFWDETTCKSALSLGKRVVTVKCPNASCSFASSELKYIDV
jgi:hypothetical protein